MFRVFDLHILISNVDPDRFIRLSFNHDPIPARILQHGSKSPSEIAPGEPFNRRGLDSNPLDLCPSRSARGKGPRERRGHDRNDISRIKSIYRLILNEVPEDG